MTFSPEKNRSYSKKVINTLKYMKKMINTRGGGSKLKKKWWGLEGEKKKLEKHKRVVSARLTAGAGTLRPKKNPLKIPPSLKFPPFQLFKKLFKKLS